MRQRHEGSTLWTDLRMCSSWKDLSGDQWRKGISPENPKHEHCEDKDLGRLADQRLTSWAGAKGIGIGLLIDRLFSR